MVRLTPLRPLSLDAAVHPRGQPHVSAASGLVCTHGRVYVVADDELHLGVFDDLVSPGRLWPLFPGGLPADGKERKRAKPDLEALLLLPPDAAWPHGALLALGSGSRPSRERAALLVLDAAGQMAGPARPVDFAALYAPLRERFDDLNIEGAFCLGEDLVLLQRGNGARGVNAALHYRFTDVAALVRGDDAPPPQPRAEHRFALGRLDGVPLGFTDAVALPPRDAAGRAAPRWLFSAAAEDTDDSYADGRCTGSVLGVADASGRLRALHRVAGACKIEGVDRHAEDGGLSLCLVSDADDPALPSVLWRAWLPDAALA
jgi:hypothetical protein